MFTSRACKVLCYQYACCITLAPQISAYKMMRDETQYQRGMLGERFITVSGYRAVRSL